MKEFVLSLVEHRIGVRIDDIYYDYVVARCADYIVSEPAELTVEVNTADVKAFNDERQYRGIMPTDDMLTPEEIQRRDAYLAATAPYQAFIVLRRKVAALLPRFGAFEFHAACIELDGSAYAFSAKSGTGKSTHAMWWKKLYGDRLTFVNGDTPLFLVKDGLVYACGSPWAGSENYNTNCIVPLRALVFLERADVDNARTIETGEALQELWHHLPRAPFENPGVVLPLLAKTAELTPCWRCGVRNDISAAEVISEAIKYKLQH